MPYGPSANPDKFSPPAPWQNQGLLYPGGEVAGATPDVANTLVSQVAVEVLVKTTSVRVSQQAVEVLRGGGAAASANVRVSQDAIEVLRTPASVYISQEAVEILRYGKIDARLSQLPVEIAVVFDQPALLSQTVIEVIGPTTKERFWVVIV